MLFGEVSSPITLHPGGFLALGRSSHFYCDRATTLKCVLLRPLVTARTGVPVLSLATCISPDAEEQADVPDAGSAASDNGEPEHGEGEGESSKKTIVASK